MALQDGEDGHDKDHDQDNENELGQLEDGISVKVPDDMAHLPYEDFKLIRTFIECFVLQGKDGKHPDESFFRGAVQQGLPSNPSKGSTGCYFLPHLPTPELGNLPRSDIIRELLSDVNKDSKQRRDIDFPCLEQVS